MKRYEVNSRFILVDRQQVLGYNCSRIRPLGVKPYRYALTVLLAVTLDYEM